MNQTNKPAAPTEEERKEKVLQVLRAAGQPLGPVEIAERINEDWCRWNGHGMGSAVIPVLRKIGARINNGKWALKEAPRARDIGPTGNLDFAPHHVMPVDKWHRIQAGLKQQA